MLIRGIAIMVCLLMAMRSQMREDEIVGVVADETVVRQGVRAIVAIRVAVKKGYHIQADTVNDPSLIPLTLCIEQVDPFSIGRPEFPPYTLFRLEGTETWLNVFDSSFLIRLPVTVPAGIRAGRYGLKGVLRYQACNARTCLFPRLSNVAINLVVRLKG